MAEVATKASEAPKKTVHLPTSLSEANSMVASCVLSPISAMKTETKTAANIFQSISNAPRPHSTQAGMRSERYFRPGTGTYRMARQRSALQLFAALRAVCGAGGVACAAGPTHRRLFRVACAASQCIGQRIGLAEHSHDQPYCAGNDGENEQPVIDLLQCSRQQRAQHQQNDRIQRGNHDQRDDWQDQALQCRPAATLLPQNHGSALSQYPEHDQRSTIA